MKKVIRYILYFLIIASVTIPVTIYSTYKISAATDDTYANFATQLFIIENTVPFDEFQIRCDYHAPFLVTF